jgi:hypothetical protein
MALQRSETCNSRASDELHCDLRFSQRTSGSFQSNFEFN